MRKTRETSRPVAEELGLRSKTRTPAVERALTDFGSETSFAEAAKRFEEHYGWPVGRTSVLRVVRDVAADAERYVNQRLEEAVDGYHEPLAQRPGVAEMLVELDGSMVPTGVLEKPREDAPLTPVRQLPQRRRATAWREVRVAFARQTGSVERTFVASMAAGYESITQSLFGAAVERGLSETTSVWAVSDGGNGLRDALSGVFAGLEFLLDRPHLKQHIHDTAQEVTEDPTLRSNFVADILAMVDAGHVAELIDILKNHNGTGENRVHQLAGYIERFADCLDYAAAANAGVPLGSGEVESAHRYIPQRRLKLPGAWWRPESINPMLALRVVKANDWWDDLWCHRNGLQSAA